MEGGITFHDTHGGIGMGENYIAGSLTVRIKSFSDMFEKMAWRRHALLLLVLLLLLLLLLLEFICAYKTQRHHFLPKAAWINSSSSITTYKSQSIAVCCSSI